jgi:hypothetical protein
MDNRAALEKALKKIRRGFGAEPGLATYNAGHLLPWLDGLDVPYLLTARHPRGWGMRPDQQTCESALSEYAGQVIASLDTPLTDEVARYWREQGVASAVYDSPSPEVEEWNGAWATWRCPEPRAVYV